MDTFIGLLVIFNVNINCESRNTIPAVVSEIQGDFRKPESFMFGIFNTGKTFLKHIFMYLDSMPFSVLVYGVIRPNCICLPTGIGLQIAIPKI